MPSRIWILLFMLPFASLSACYHYVNVRPDEVPLGVEVRTSVTEVGLDQIRGSAGRNHPLLRTALLEGIVVGRLEDGLMLAIPIAGSGRDVQATVLNQRFVLPRGEILAVRMRRLDRGRTIAIAALTTAALGAILYKALSGEFGAEGGFPDGSGPPESRVPVDLSGRP